LVAEEGTNMPIVKVWLLPKGKEQEWYDKLWEDLFDAFGKVPELGLSRDNPKSVTINFPDDHSKKGLGEFTWIEVERMFNKPERTLEVKFRLARELGLVLRRHLPDLKFTEVFVGDDTFWFWDESHTDDLPVFDDCQIHGSIEHVQSATGKCPGCGK
jgi:hypothetical protein